MDGIDPLQAALGEELVQHLRHRLIVIGLEEIGRCGHLIPGHGIGVGGGDEHQRTAKIQFPQAAGHFNAQNVVHEVVQKGQVKVLPVLHVVDQPQAAAIGRHLDAPAPLGGIVVHHAHQQLPVQLAVLTNRDAHKNSPLRLQNRRNQFVTFLSLCKQNRRVFQSNVCSICQIHRQPLHFHRQRSRRPRVWYSRPSKSQANKKGGHKYDRISFRAGAVLRS